MLYEILLHMYNYMHSGLHKKLIMLFRLVELPHFLLLSGCCYMKCKGFSTYN